jgi:hypothetical protein
MNSGIEERIAQELPQRMFWMLTSLCPLCGASNVGEAATCNACGEALVPTADGAMRPVRRFRWRLVPAIVSGFMGIWMLSLSLLAIGMMTWRFAEKPELLDYMMNQHPLVLLELLMKLLGGTAFIVAARLWWVGKWRWGVAMCIIAVL